MAYTAHEWSTGEAITRDKMNTIEQGIEDAYSLAQTAKSTAESAVNVNDTQTSRLSELSTSITNVDAKLGEDFSSTNTVTTVIANLRTALEQGSGDGTRAWSQLVGAGVNYNANDGTYIKTLAQVLAQYPLTSEIITPAINTPSSTDTVLIDNAM